MNLTVMKNTNDILGLARNTFSALLICAMPAMASAQTYVTPVRSDITPPTPQSEAIMAVQAPQPDLLTGAVSLGVPLYTINVDGVECPLSLQYQTNGITVLSDPVPLGYGWSLMPALRITRTVLGRPDEKYPFSGDPLAYQEPNAMCYMCAVNHYAQSFTHKERYDSEHDIVNICLPDKSLTRVMEATADTIVFSGACDSEYRVEADRNLNTITVTDPSGTRYYFGDIYEGIHDQTGYLVRTAWPLYKIETDTGREINLSWSFNRHPAGRRSWNGGYSFMDRINPSFMKSRENLDNDQGAQALLTPANETLDFLQLDGISFPGGNVTFGYKWTDRTGGMLTSVKISSTGGVIKSYSLTYADTNCTLLTEVDGGEGNRYSFEYNTKYGTNPFSSLSRGRHSQDWWGYYNDKDNVSLTPKIQDPHGAYGDRRHKHHGTLRLQGADRSVGKSHHKHVRGHDLDRDSNLSRKVQRRDRGTDGRGQPQRSAPARGNNCRTGKNRGKRTVCRHPRRSLPPEFHHGIIRKLDRGSSLAPVRV